MVIDPGQEHVREYKIDAAGLQRDAAGIPLHYGRFREQSPPFPCLLQHREGCIHTDNAAAAIATSELPAAGPGCATEIEDPTRLDNDRRKAMQ